MRKKYVIILTAIVIGFFIISNFPVTYANADNSALIKPFGIT